MKDWVGNKNSIFKTIGASNHTDEERPENDFYATDPIAIDKLLKVETPNHNIWECAAGEGHLSNRLKELGFNVFSSDIIERSFKLDAKIDFLNYKCKKLAGDILTNPPYKYAKEFIIHSIRNIKQDYKVYMFLKLTFLEGKARFNEIFSKFPPKRIYVFSERIMCAKNAEFQKMKDGGGSAVAYAWFVWQKGYKGRTIVEWI